MREERNICGSWISLSDGTEDQLDRRAEFTCRNQLTPHVTLVKTSPYFKMPAALKCTRNGFVEWVREKSLYERGGPSCA